MRQMPKLTFTFYLRVTKRSSVISTVYSKWPFCYNLPFVTPFTVSHLLQGKENSKYENWLFFFFFFSKVYLSCYLFSQALVLLIMPWACMHWSNLTSSVLIFPIKLMEVRGYLLQLTAAAAVLTWLLLARTLSQACIRSVAPWGGSGSESARTPSLWQGGSSGVVAPGMWGGRYP